jgi:long-chain fatty acid transport protein
LASATPFYRPEGAVLRPLPVLLRVFLLSSLAVTSLLPGVVCAQGIALSGVGPVNRAMAGAATAAPIDAAGALYWNPASISGLQTSEMSIALELLLPTENLSSAIGPGALGGGFPPVQIAGSTDGEPGVAAIPTMALVHKCQDSPWSYGLGMFAIGGFQTNYPASTSNPVLMPQGNTPGGFGGLGRIDTQSQFFQIVPTASYAITDRLSVGLAPTVTVATLSADPLFLVSPDDADGSGAPTYPSGCGTRANWGGGFQVGAYYITDNSWHFGFCFKSQQWFEPIRVNTQNELGLPRRESVRFDYPLVLSLGAAYAGFENWLLACDVRYFDYENAAGFGDPAGFDAGGRVTGLGWKSIVSVHLAAQYQATERLYLRLGYQYNDNPIGSEEAFFNVASPLIIQHILSTGLSYHLTDCLIVSLAYVHGFENEAAGPLQVPGLGPLAGTSVASKISADALTAGFTLRY